MSGPLQHLRIVEFAGQGPGPFAGMMLADMGADVVRIDRLRRGDSGASSLRADSGRSHDILGRGKRSITIDLKRPQGVEVAERLIDASDILIEGYRPGVMERLGLGPEECLRRKPGLIYGRMTGWGQDGPYAQMPGHDINYIALSGVLGTIGPKEGAPVPPLNLVGDFGGGGLLLAFGLLAAVIETGRSGRGQVVDASMVEGSALLMAAVYGMFASGWWTEERGTNMLDGGAPYYGVYQAADGGYISVGAVEDKFYQAFLEGLGQDPEILPPRSDVTRWTDIRSRLAKVIASKTRDEWAAFFEDREACVAPVLSMSEAIDHKHNRHRRTFIEVDGVLQPAPAPRFSRTAPSLPGSEPTAGESGREILRALGLADAEVDELIAARVVDAPPSITKAADGTR